MARLTLLAFLVLALSNVVSGAPTPDDVHDMNRQDISHCGGSGDILSATTSPDTPVLGKELSVTVIASTPVTIASGSIVNFSVTGGGGGSFNLCGVTNCPIKIGEYSFTYSVTLPKEANPTEGVRIHTEGYSPSNQKLFCFDFTPVKPRCQVPYPGLPPICH